MSRTDQPTAQPEPAGSISPYGERDLESAERAVAVWRDRPIRARIAEHELVALVREVAGVVATARAEGYAEGQRDERARRHASEGDVLVIDDADDEAWQA